MRTRIALGLVATLFLSTQALAATILFQDDFDNVDGSGAGNPAVATIGSYGPGSGVQARDAGDNLSPSPSQVSSPNHAVVNSPGGIFLNFASAANTTQILRTEFDIWTSGGAGGIEFDFYDPAYQAFTQFLNPAGTMNIDGSVPGFTLPLEVWSHVTMDYDPVAGNLTLSVNANTQTLNFPDGKAFTRINVSTFGNGIGRLDNILVTLDPVAIPEPSGIILSVSAMFGLMACARRKRQ